MCGNGKQRQEQLTLWSDRLDFTHGLRNVVQQYSWFTWNPLLCLQTSLWPRRTVEERLRLLGSRARVPKEPSDGPPGLWGGAPVPLEDHQNANDEPEEEVDPRCRLRGERTRVKNTKKTDFFLFFWCPTLKSKECVYLSLEQTVVEPLSFEWFAPSSVLCILTAFKRKKENRALKHLLWTIWFRKKYRFGGRSHLVTLGTVLVTELQRESRPIFSTQPVTRRKNKKAPHKAMMPFIHRRSLRKGEEERINSRRRNNHAMVCPPLQVFLLLPLQATTPVSGSTRCLCSKAETLTPAYFQFPASARWPDKDGGRVPAGAHLVMTPSMQKA